MRITNQKSVKSSKVIANSANEQLIVTNERKKEEKMNGMKSNKLWIKI